MFALFPEIIHKVASGDLETLACLVRKYFADRQIYSPRLSVEPLMTQAGIHLSRDDIPDAAKLLASDHRGAFQVSVILGSSIRDFSEINFTLAHLFGRFLFEMQPLMAKGEMSSKDIKLKSGALRRCLNTKGGSSEERRADAFAIALLTPPAMVRRAHESLGNATATAAFFKIHPQLMQQRLTQLALFSPPTESAVQAEPRQVPPPVLTQNEPKRAAAKASPPVGGEDSNSVVKAQKSLAAFNYRREEEATAKVNTQASTSKSRPATKDAADSGEGLRRLRAIARKIDGSVDV